MLSNCNTKNNLFNNLTLPKKHTKTMNPKLYMSPYSPPARAVLMTTEAIGLKLNFKEVDMTKSEHLQPEYCKMNPQHTIPTLDDNGAIIWDSHAIMSYIVEKYGKNDNLYPKDLLKRALVNQRLHFDTGSFFSVLRTIMRSLKFKGIKEILPEWKENANEAYNFLELFLTGKDWVAGDSVTIADLSLLSTATSINIVVPIDESKYPNLIAWIKRCKKLPFYHVNEPGLNDFKNTAKQLLNQ